MFHLGAQNEHINKSVCFSLSELYLSGGQMLSVALSKSAPSGDEDFQNCPDFQNNKYLLIFDFLSDLRTLL